MKIILNKNIHNLGKKNDVVTVAPGYARNYLIPNGIALEATKGMYKAVVELEKQGVHKLEILKTEAQNLAQRLSQIKLEIRTKAGARGKVFGAVNSTKVAEALAEQGVTVDKHNIIIANSIKELGNYTIKLKLHDQVECDLTLSVIPS
jgi:large subunit ribosomal protein L9